MRNWCIAALGLLVAACATQQKSGVEAELEKKRAEIALLESQLTPEQRAELARKRFVSGHRAGEFQDYVNLCLNKIVRAGNSNVPDEVRGKLQGLVRLTFAVRSDGNLESVKINQSSGLVALDTMLVDAVRISAPFDRFPSSFPAEVEVLFVTQSFEYVKSEQGGRVEP